VDTADKPNPERVQESRRTEDWLFDFAAALADLSGSPLEGEAGLSRTETGTLLRLARDVAHGVERRFAPLAAYLTGRFVAGRLQQGATVDEALAEAEAAARRLIGPG
jgi:uncharacterized protein DUF6457